MKVLGIETSCDETAVAVLDIENSNIKVLSNVVSSQVKLHAKYGGVVPNLAAREHVKNIEHVFKLALKKAGIKDFEKEIDLIAVTRGPGLGPALLVGITFARTIAWKYKKPLAGVNHLEGHIYSNWLSQSKILNSKKIFPILNLIVSGGHTELVLMEDYNKYRVIGETLDDAVGEAFDKVARLLGLGYPGGPILSKLADKGNSDRYPLPSPMIYLKNYNFSYSGLKTAVLYLLRDLELSAKGGSASGGKKIDAGIRADISASFQKAAFEVIFKKTMRAAGEFGVQSIFLSGGVSANKYLRENLKKLAEKNNLNYFQPEFEYTGDNAAMIAIAGYFSAQGGSASGGNYSKNKKAPYTWDLVEMDANLSLKQE